MKLTARDRKILLALVPLLIVGAYWFLLLSPKREESASVGEKLAQAEDARDSAQAQATALTNSKKSFGRDYAAVISLGKSVPSKVDMPSLLVQLDTAAKGTGINFVAIETGERAGAPGSAPASGSGSSGSGSGGSGGSGSGSSTSGAASGPGQAGQAAQGAANTASGSANSAAGANPGGAAPAGGAAASSGAPGLESVPLTFDFTGSFFDLADFFHRMKRFVRVANEQIVVNGRLITIDSFGFDSTSSFPNIKAKVKATVYLAPRAQGVAAGASPQGPSPAAPTPSTPQTASTPTAPAATVTTP